MVAWIPHVNPLSAMGDVHWPVIVCSNFINTEKGENDLGLKASLGDNWGEIHYDGWVADEWALMEEQHILCHPTHPYIKKSLVLKGLIPSDTLIITR